MLVTLAAFIAGSVLGAWHAPWWGGTPAWGSMALIPAFGLPGAFAVSGLLIGAVAGVSIMVERRVHGRLVSPAPVASEGFWGRLSHGPWPLAAGAVGLALVNVATLLLAGRPWGVSSALALWGSKLLLGLGVDVTAWPYWSSEFRAATLQASVVSDVTSVMNFGIIVGALTAAGLSGRFTPAWRVPLRSLAGAVLGGLLLGYGARIAYGCNIGAYFGGVASASLHGWLWMVAAFTGSALGTQLRPVFGLPVERTSRPSGC